MARRKEPLDTLVTELAAEEIEAAAFQADLARPELVPGVVSAIREHFGRIDIVEYSPITTAPFIPAAELTQSALEPYVQVFLYSPIAVVNAVLPEMLSRRDGAILITHGGTAARPVPMMSGAGPIMATARNYLFALNGEVADKGVFVGTLTNSAVIVGSAFHELVQSGAFPGAAEIPTVSPDELADIYHQMVINRKPIETDWPPLAH